MSGAVLCPPYMPSWRGLGKLCLLNPSVCLTTLLITQNVNLGSKHKETIMHGHDRHNTTMLSIVHNMSSTF